jgi:hypothetical protein
MDRKKKKKKKTEKIPKKKTTKKKNRSPPAEKKEEGVKKGGFFPDDYSKETEEKVIQSSSYLDRMQMKLGYWKWPQLIADAAHWYRKIQQLLQNKTYQNFVPADVLATLFTHANTIKMHADGWEKFMMENQSIVWADSGTVS